MYDITKKLVLDRREMLRVKVKSLAEEARIIRREEHRNWGTLRDELHLHRVGVVRREARAAHLAYGFIRGRSYSQMEGKLKDPRNGPDWEKVRRLCKTYGPKDFSEPAELQLKKAA